MKPLPSAESPALHDRLGLGKLLIQFDRAWQAGATPRIEDFLPRCSSAGPFPSELRQILEELVKIDLEYRRRQSAASTAWSLEDYVQRYPELGPLERLPVELIGWEYLVRQRLGDRPSHQEYVSRFRHQEPLLRQRLAQIDVELAAEFAGKGPGDRAALAEAVPLPAGVGASEPIISVGSFVKTISECKLLRPTALDQVTRDLSPACPDPRTLAKELLQRGWLTPYQINQILHGRGAGLVIGPYIVLERLGEGGTGQVFKARHQKMERIVALKVIRKELLTDAEVVGRFYREIEVVSRLDHANVVHAYDAGPAGPTHFLAMEYIEGTDLAKLVKQGGPLPVLQACEYVRQAALGLQHAHEKGLVHRDIKPHNLIMSVRDGLIKVADLGLARLPPAANAEVTAALTGVKGSGTLTPENAVMIGTADYLAPEQALDFHKADIRADIYSLGCTFYYLLTGQPPYPGTTLAEKLVKHQQAEPPALEQFRKDLPGALPAVVRKMLAKRPEDRYQTPADVAAALAVPLGISARPAVRLPRRARLVLSASLLLAVGLVAWFLIVLKPPPMRNAQLRNLPENECNKWVKIGSLQVPERAIPLGVTWCYDPNGRQFVRVGGAGSVPPAFSNEVWGFDLGNLNWTPILPCAFDQGDPKRGLGNRPGYGPYRGICYDRDHRCVWDYSGVVGSISQGVKSGLWKGVGDLGEGKWSPTQEVPGNNGDCRVAYDEYAKRVICIASESGTGRIRTYVYDPDAKAEPRLKMGVIPGDSKNNTLEGTRRFGWCSGFIYVPELKGCLLVTLTPVDLKKDGPLDPGCMATLLFDATARQWRELNPKGPTISPRSGMSLSYDRKNRVMLLFGGRSHPTNTGLNDTWLYDPKQNSWREIKQEGGPARLDAKPTQEGDCQMLAYDEEHDVHVLVRNWGGDNAIWVYRYRSR
jgi:serine/threonine protein kinase